MAAPNPHGFQRVRVRITDWRTQVLQAEPDFPHKSRVVREYIFSATDPRTGGPREFFGDYKRRGNYTPEPEG